MTVTRTKLYRCSTKDCTFTLEEHEEWQDLCRRTPGHVHRDDQMTHAHFPKKGMGGNNWKSKIRAYICWPLHDLCDNGLYEMILDRNGFYINDACGVTILATSDEVGEGLGSGSPTAGAEVPSPTPPGVAPQGADAGASERATLSPLGQVESSTPAMTSPSVQFLDNGLDFEPEITFEDWLVAASRVGLEEVGRQWRAGDCFNAGERFAERAEQHWDVFGYPFETLMNYGRIAEAYPIRTRVRLSWAHHRAVYKLEDRHEWLRKAVENEWTLQELREAALPVTIRPKRWNLEELWAALDGYQNRALRNNGRQFAEAFLNSLEMQE